MGSLESNRHTFYIMPGYKHEWTVSEKTKVYAGANIGMANLSDKTKMKMDRVYKDHDSDWGFAYSAEVGGSYAICPDWSVFAAIEIFGAKVTPISSFAEEPVYTGVRFGVSHQF